MSIGLPRHTDPNPSADRFHTSADGTQWRVWLEHPPRHILRTGDDRMLLTFVHMHAAGEKQRYDVVRRVAVGTLLDSLGGDELERLLAGV